ncbi:MAG: ClbS/DfsB family four-helix bundle protein [Micrococcales bacterium]|nr:ClbS/DfsB family four-helix bundle protein [Micrococcales bacterium]
MPRPTNRSELLAAAQDGYDRIMALIGSFEPAWHRPG